jgi:hypothetical protein
MLFSAALLMVVGSQANIAAQTTTTTGISVEVVDAGSFSIGIGIDGVTFTAEGGIAPEVTAFSGATAYAFLPLTLTDTRSSEGRGRYEVRLKVGELTVGDETSSSMIIEPANIQVTDVDGLPEGLARGFEGSASLESPVTLFATGNAAPAVETTIRVALRMEIPAGTMPGSFSGDISIEVIPIV